MNLLEKIGWYHRNYGFRALIVRVVEVLVGAKPSHQSSSMTVRFGKPKVAHIQGGAGFDDHRQGVPDQAVNVFGSRFLQNQPLPVFTAPGPDQRINLVTDSVNAGSLFGGVGTAIILAAELAKARGALLRVVTRTQEADERGVAQVLECNGIQFQGNIEFSHVGINSGVQLDICDGDLFLTTSWWTTESVLGSIKPERVVYLLQEDERMFYPHGDDWIRCNAILSRKDIRFILNTQLLYRHLVENGLQNIASNGVWFEPAFPEEMFHLPAERDGTSDRKLRLFFYARPNNLRNLYYLGLEVLDRACAAGILRSEQWEIVFVGKDARPVQFSDGSEAIVLKTMSWKEYGEFVRSVDVGLCLMATPHPSYPPLDLAASGAVVVSNIFGLKQRLDTYSSNIILAEPSVEGLVSALEQATSLSQNAAVRHDNYLRNGISRSWAMNLESVVQGLA